MINVGVQLALPRAGRRLQVRRLIGEGSQGSVFEAADEAGSVAVKWYHAATGTAAQRRRIEDLVERGAPNDRFLWPTEVLDLPGDGSFGYVMPLRPPTHAGLVDLLTGSVDVGFATVCRLGLELTGSFLALHAQGLCYRDISFSNVFFDPLTGLPLICDNDNVGVDGAGPPGVLGTRRFMAPELVRGEATPSIDTDLYSLAVLLFYLLMMGHPLVGQRELAVECWDDRAESELFGRSPLFVFDPDDRSNRATPGVHDALLRYWSLYPAFVRDLFQRAFTVGLTDPRHGRVRESWWRNALARLRDALVRCPACSKENFVDPDGAAGACWSCGEAVPEPLWLRVDQRLVALGLGSKVFGHHVAGDYDYSTTIAAVTVHPERPELLGLQNLGDHPWLATLSSGRQHVVEPGRSVRLDRGTSIDLGRVRGHVVERRAAEQPGGAGA